MTLNPTKLFRVRPRPKRVLSQWIVVKVQPHRERWAAKNVRQQGYRAFAPFISNEGETKESPLFPGYIFVLGPNWYYLRGTYGVIAPIMMGSTPAYMPLKEMQALLKSAGEDDVITIGKERFTPGQRVLFQRGPWAGHVGVFKRSKAGDRVRVLLSLLGGQHEMEFAHHDITAAPAEKGGVARAAKAR